MRGILYLILGIFLTLLAIHFTTEDSFARSGRTAAGNGHVSNNLDTAEEAFVDLRQLVEISSLSRIPASSAIELKSNNIRRRILSRLSLAKKDALKSNDANQKYVYNKLVNDIYFWQQGYPQKVFFSHPDYQSYLIQ